MAVASASPGRKCPVCAGKMVHPDNCLAKLDPEIAALWHQPQNDLTPYDLTLNSVRKAWFKCENGHCTLTAVPSKVKSEVVNFVLALGATENTLPQIFNKTNRI